ncbi:hypothetical protein OCS_03761 [Ophiocordyceps sinensis CO18]|uniref:Pentapeptide MXKDX repeat protein n=1 Tax=Ophiocordyceps sinensis (strain Co18 / CGMCC 3.14243) TaxID=911162 RepID=T5AD55_OPHSC|nr:hypothetical protein OCS_03761 [Ophiocordyceps sinensis CO18]
MKISAILAACLASGALAASAGAQQGAAGSKLQAINNSALNDAQHGTMDGKANVRRADMRGKKKKRKKRKRSL